MLARAGLQLLAIPYGIVIYCRNQRFDKQSSASTEISIPVISVGNITTGGTGKTPLVEFIARYLRQQQIRVTIVSRGYGSQEGKPNDEALELERKLPDVPHLQNPDRVAAARTAIAEFEAQLILLDDAFQHRPKSHQRYRYQLLLMCGLLKWFLHRGPYRLSSAQTLACLTTP